MSKDHAHHEGTTQEKLGTLLNTVNYLCELFHNGEKVRSRLHLYSIPHLHTSPSHRLTMQVDWWRMGKSFFFFVWFFSVLNMRCANFPMEMLGIQYSHFSYATHQFNFISTSHSVGISTNNRYSLKTLSIYKHLLFIVHTHRPSHTLVEIRKQMARFKHRSMD